MKTINQFKAYFNNFKSNKDAKNFTILAIASIIPILLIATLFADQQERSVAGVTTPPTTTTTQSYVTATPTPIKINGIAGKVFVDDDSDGGLDKNEVGVEGVRVSLYKSGAKTAFEVDETDIDGNYTFTKLTSGNYKLDIDPPSGYKKLISSSVSVIYKGGSLTLNFGVKKIEEETSQSKPSAQNQEIKQLEKPLIKNSEFSPIVAIAIISAIILIAALIFLYYKRNKRSDKSKGKS